MSMNTSGAGSLSRRATLKGAGLAVGTLWVVPLVQVISMESASAASAPPSRVQTGGGAASAPPPLVQTGGGTAPVASGPTSGGSLPQTGASPTVGLVAAGLAAVAVGAGAVVASRRLAKGESPEPAE